MEKKELIKYFATLALAKKDFWTYCQIKANDFYLDNRTYLKYLCNNLENFYKSDDHVLVVNMPPRHGKSRTAQLFVEWLLGNDNSLKIMTGSYNEMLSTMFAKSVRNSIQELKLDKKRIVYTDIFPDTRIKKGDGSMNFWSLESGYNNYLATSPGGSATGMGANILIIDDIIKNAEEAYNEITLEKHWEWYTNTMLSRLEEGDKIIIIMTRWSTNDLAGRVLEHYKDDRLRLVTMKAVQDDGTMLCEDILSKATYEDKIRAMNIDIASANYQQEPIDIKGRLYSGFKTYTKFPTDDKGNLLFTEIKNYTDTADTGDDYLCSICYGVYNNEAYILDIVYTKEPMEVTELSVAKMCFKNKVSLADIESNSGGRGFSRSVKRILEEKYNSNYTIVNAFHQSKNKIARILSNATWVMNHIYFPINWQDRFPEYYEAMVKYQREGKNIHDDAPDATTGIAEKVNQGNTFSFE